MDMGWREALALMRRALIILDQSKAPPLGVAETLDLAIARLAAHVEASGGDDSEQGEV